MTSKAFCSNQEACNDGAITAAVMQERIDAQLGSGLTFASTSQMNDVSRLNQVAICLVAQIESEHTAVPSDDSRLEEASNFLHQALLDIDGVLAVPPPQHCWSVDAATQVMNLSTSMISSQPSLSLTNSPYKLPSHQQPEYDEGMRCFKALLPVDAEIFDRTPRKHQLAATVLYNIGQVRLLQKRYDAAHSSFVDAYIMADCAPSDTNSIVLPILHNLGYIQYRNGDVDTSLQTFTAAFQFLQGETSRSIAKAHIAATLNCLGVLHFHMPKSDTTRSLDCLLRALSLFRIVNGTPVRTVATMLNNIGRVHYIDGNFDAALLAYNEALRLRRRLLGDDHLDVAATIFNLGQTYHHQGNLVTALQQYEEFLRIALPQLGRYHRDVAFMLKCIAQIHFARGKDSRALQFYREALVSCRAALGVHVEVASVLNKLGNLYFGQGDYDASLDMYEQGLQVERAVFDRHHPNIAVTLSNIAQIHKQRGESAQAFRLYEEVHALQLGSVGNRDPSVAATLSNMALMHYQNRNHATALELYQEALGIRQESFGDENLDVASTLNSIGLVLFKLKALPMALDSFSRSLKIRQSLLGDVHRDIAVNLYNIATIQMELGNDDEAMRFYMETLRVEKHSLGSEHPDIVQTLSYIAHAHRQRGNVSEALLCFAEVLQIQRKHLADPQDLNIGRTLKCIGNLCLLRGDGGGCVEALSEALRISIRHGQPATEGFAEFQLLGFHLYSLAKQHPEAAQAA